ncbi:hypothetical protein EVAR_37215_1 [Eumeta japonica]|uniref:Uncharacterized protein n=1 Tax=Eumeta variegata TaxID=151549 RepID=A0A4C1Y4G9_EUMVA|nr:hypothetical protein EVAR_37215_1 [Eumeta japonica]
MRNGPRSRSWLITSSVVIRNERIRCLSTRPESWKRNLRGIGTKMGARTQIESRDDIEVTAGMCIDMQTGIVISTSGYLEVTYEYNNKRTSRDKCAKTAARQARAGRARDRGF